MSKTLILLIDDEQDILDLIEYNLHKQGYDVITADNGSTGLSLAEKYRPGLILLDIMMPKMDGHQVCTHLKNNPSLEKIPVIFLTARGDEETEVKGLDQGADDYLIKPITISKLISRIKAVLRRVKEPEEIQNNLHFGDVEIDRSRYIVTKSGKEIHLPRKEFELLFYLAGNKGKVLSREILLNNIWGNVYVVDRTIDVHIRKIREKLGDECIETVKGVGYRFKNETT